MVQVTFAVEECESFQPGEKVRIKENAKFFFEGEAIDHAMGEFLAGKVMEFKGIVEGDDFQSGNAHVGDFVVTPDSIEKA